jgi:hypothetical protein
MSDENKAKVLRSLADSTAWQLKERAMRHQFEVTLKGVKAGQHQGVTFCPVFSEDVDDIVSAMKLALDIYAPPDAELSLAVADGAASTESEK